MEGRICNVGEGCYKNDSMQGTNTDRGRDWQDESCGGRKGSKESV